MTAAPRGTGSPPTSCGVSRPRPSRSKAASTSTGAGRRSGTRSAPPPARSRAATTPGRRPTTGTAWPRTWPCWRPSASRPTGSRSPGRGSCPPAAAPVSEAGLDFYRALVDELLGAGRGARGHALPLGSPAGARGRRGLAGPRHRVAVRRVRRRRRRRPRRPGPALDDDQRAVVRVDARLRGRGARARAGPSPARRWPPPTTCCSPTASPSTPCGPRRVPRRRSPSRLNPYPVVAAGPTDADRDAARRVDGVANRLWYDAVLRGRYPDDVLEDFSTVSDLTHIRDGDLAQIARPLDALGLNYYRRHHVRSDAGRVGGRADRAVARLPRRRARHPAGAGDRRRLGGRARRAPGGAGRASPRSYDPPPLYVHEAGAAYDDDLDPQGEVHDDGRVRLAGRPPPQRSAGRGPGRRPPRVLRVVAARQLRVGRGLPPPVRDRARRLRHPGAHARRRARGGTDRSSRRAASGDDG